MLDRTRNAAVAAIAAAAMAAAPLPALALGKKEKGFLMGVAAAVIVDQLVERNRSARAPTYFTSPNPSYPTYSPEYREPSYYEPSYREPSRFHDDRTACCASSGTSVNATPAAQAFRSYSAWERRAIQERLRIQGYYRGAIDGTFGPATYEAVSLFATDRGMRANLRSTAGAFSVYDSLL